MEEEQAKWGGEGEGFHELIDALLPEKLMQWADWLITANHMLFWASVTERIYRHGFP